MVRLSKNENRKLNLKIGYEKLIEHFKFRQFFVEFGFGYIAKYDTIQQNEHKGTIKTIFENDDIVLSSIVIDWSLTRLKIGGLRFNIE